MIWLQAAMTAVVCAVYIADFIKNNKKIPLCDTCEYLYRKGCKSGSAFRYTCIPDGKYCPNYFDRPPEYCKNYKPRESKKDD